MANIASQIKRNRQNQRRHERNKAVRSRYRRSLRRFDDAVATGDREAAEEAFRVAQRELDRAAGKGVIHANKAANNKSRMARELDRL